MAKNIMVTLVDRDFFNAGIINGKYWYIKKGEIKELPNDINKEIANAIEIGVLREVKPKAKIVKEKKKKVSKNGGD